LPRAAKKIEDETEREFPARPPIDDNGETELTEAEKRALLVYGLAEIERIKEESKIALDAIKGRLISVEFQKNDDYLRPQAAQGRRI